MPTLLSVQVGAVQQLGGSRPWRSAYMKAPVSGPVQVRGELMDGDAQFARQFHGGPDRVVLAYAAAHYPGWRAQFPQYAFPYGAFAENLTVEGLDERTVCIGDRHRIGSVVLEVTMPRVPCGKISLATGVEALFDEVRETGKIGWLYRLIQEGELEAGQAIAVEPGGHDRWTVAHVYDVSRRMRAEDDTARADCRELAAVGPLAADWRERMGAFGAHL